MEGGDNLLTPEERETQRQWDREHAMRVKELQRRAQSALDRRRYLHQKREDLNIRWRDLEERRISKERDYYNRLVTICRQKSFS